MLEASIGPAPMGASRKRRRMPCSRKVTSCTLSPQKLPITVSVNMAPKMYAIQPVEFFPEISRAPKRKTSGMTRLKKKNARLRMASRMRACVSVQVWLRAFVPILIPQPAAGQLDEHIFERRGEHFQALQFVILGFELFYQRDDRLRRTRRVQHVSAVEFPAIGNTFKKPEHAVA